MPKSQVKKSKLFRESSKLSEKYVKHNYLKNIRNVKAEFVSKNAIVGSWLDLMLWLYDLEFFTINYVAEEYGMYKDNLADRLIYPMLKEGYLYKHFDKLTPSQTMEDHLFREETKYNYRVRYALSQKGRMAVQRFYNAL
jgi:hypothetical protein|tara:strand:- start:150 stop:566 length:417 start_codon:yes stop_codon:yes gene_type:complete